MSDTLGRLTLVGTPIGNLSDFSPRAIEALQNCDFIAAEDTRVTLKLLNHFGINKQPLPEKMFGVFRHTVDYKRSILFRGFDDKFVVPHSRHTTCLREDIAAVPEIKILASSDEAGVFACATDKGRQIFITGHSEYDADTLKNEYFRDKNAGLPIDVPKNYFPDDDDSKAPVVRWRSCANLLYSNWLNYFVYQSTPYDIEQIK